MKLSDLLCDVYITSVKLGGVDVAVETVGNIPVSGISTYSGKTVPGDVFVCINGMHTDGHLFARASVDRGAVAVISERELSLPVPVIITDNTRDAAARVWNRFYGCPAEGMTLVAVTGTNGKTSVSFMLRHILSEAGYTTGLVGTVGCMAGAKKLPYNGLSEVEGTPAAMTTPDPMYLYKAFAEMRDAGVSHTVMEASSHAIAQKKISPLTPDLAVFTGLSPEHLDFHGDTDSYFMTKAELFRHSGRGIINTDSPDGRRLVKMDLLPVRTFGMKGGDYSAENVYDTADGVEYTLLHLGGRCAVRCSMPGIFGVMNSLAAIGAADILGISPHDSTGYLESFSGVPGRMEQIVSECGIRVIRDYAHTPEAMLKAAQIVGATTKNRLWLLFGCGGDRDKKKRPEMGRIATTVGDMTVITSDNCRTERCEDIIADILSGVVSDRYTVIPDRREAIRFAVLAAEDGDTVLLLGKGHENYEITSEGIFPFDEVQITVEAVKEKHHRKDVLK